MQFINDGQFAVTPKNGAFIVGATNFTFAMIGALLSLKLGSKTLLLTGHSMMCLSGILIGVFMVTSLYEALFAFVLVFIASFQIS